MFKVYIYLNSIMGPYDFEMDEEAKNKIVNKIETLDSARFVEINGFNVRVSAITAYLVEEL